MKLTDSELDILGIAREDVSTVAGGTFVPPAPAPGFVPPAWFPLLSYALTSGIERGAMLFGPRGSGKSTAIRELARSFGAETITMQCAANMQIDSLIGCWTVENGATQFVDGPLTLAVRRGAWLLAEEANVLHPGVWSAVNTLTDKTGEGLRLPTGENIPNSPGFRLVLLYNEGASYSGTREVNAALKRRLVPIYCDYPNRQSESAILAGLTGATQTELDRLLDCATMIRAANLRFDLSTDILARWFHVVQAGVGTWAESYRMVICDMLGAPDVTIAQRTVLAEIALQCGMESWA